MKLLIVEGLDRCGKDSLISSIIKESPNSKVVHWGFPQGNTNEDRIAYQKMSFEFFMREYSFLKMRNELDFLIWNRSHIGECVYGPMYRNSPSEWIFDLEKEFLTDSQVYLVYLHGDVEFLLKNDDGESFTTDIEKKRNEARLFEEAVDKSLIKNKIKIKVNDGNSYVNGAGITGTVRYFLSI